MGLLLAGAAGLRRRRARAASALRRVSLADVEQLSVDDVPTFWNPNMTIARSRRFKAVESIRQQLDKTFFMMAFTYAGLSTFDQREAKAMFPPTVKVRGLKKSQVVKATQGTGWHQLAEQIKGQSFYVFVESDKDFKPTIQAYIKFAKKFNRAEKCAELFEKAGTKGFIPPSSGGIMIDEWNYIPGEELPKYKDFPTKSELIAQIAGSIKQVPTKLAVCAKQLPQKTAIGIKKIVEKMEEDGKATVGEVAV